MLVMVLSFFVIVLMLMHAIAFFCPDVSNAQPFWCERKRQSQTTENGPPQPTKEVVGLTTPSPGSIDAHSRCLWAHMPHLKTERPAPVLPPSPGHYECVIPNAT